MRRIFVTGATGFVGSNLLHVFENRHGAEVVAPSHEELELTDADAVRRAVAAAEPDAIVHAAIWNDPVRLVEDRRRAWETYVSATRNAVDAANAVGARMILVSTDWVFDGTQGPAAETEPPNPINTYGFLKAASELVVSQRAARGTVARVAGVQGVHRARTRGPRTQDAGFGYLVLSLVQALRAGKRFDVWDGEGLNVLATPVLASDAAEMVWLAIERDVDGILHCTGSEHVDRIGLTRRAVEIFDLDPELLHVSSPPSGAIPSGGVPRDTRLDTMVTAEALGTMLPDLSTTLRHLREELDEVS